MIKRYYLFFNSEKKIHQWEASAETVTPDLVEDFFDYFEDGGGGDKTLCNFYGSTEMMDVTFAAFRSAEDARDLVIDGKVNQSPKFTNFLLPPSKLELDARGPTYEMHFLSLRSL